MAQCSTVNVNFSSFQMGKNPVLLTTPVWKI
jgi:hypothetical protein